MEKAKRLLSVLLCLVLVLTAVPMNVLAEEQQTAPEQTESVEQEGECAHSWSEWERTEATCTEDGSESRSCTLCGEIETVAVSAGHSGEWEIIIEPTCLGEGYRVRVCTVCSEAEEEIMDPIGHSFDTWETIRTATCTEAGEKKSTCTGCTESMTEQLPALGHSWSTYETTVQPTCTETGMSRRYCFLCEIKEETILPAAGHSWSDWGIESAPTCDESGSYYRDCSVCGQKETKAGESALGHDWGEWILDYAPTCTEDGGYYRICTACGTRENKVGEPALGHDWSEWILDYAPTCTEDGGYYRICTACGTRENKVGELALGHDYLSEEKSLSCTEDGCTVYTCSRCGDTYRENVTPAPGHSWSEWDYRIQPQCTTKGLRRRSCSACGKTEIEVLDPLGHSMSAWKIIKGATCTETGEMYRVCSACAITENITTKKRAHDYTEWEITEDIEQLEKYKTRYCKVCGTENYIGLPMDPPAVLDSDNKDSAGVKYLLNSDGTATVTENSATGHIVIPSLVSKDGTVYRVTSIGEKAFYSSDGYRWVPSVVIPDSVTSIGAYAFCLLTYLEDVNIPDSVTTIGNSAFSKVSVRSVTIPDSVTSIGDSAFSGSRISTLTIGKNVRTIDRHAFAGCISLRNVYYNVTDLDDSSYDTYYKPLIFDQSGVFTLTVGKNVERIPSYLFEQSWGEFGPGNVVFEEGSICRSIGMHAFCYCDALENVTIPSSVNIIEKEAFYDCDALENVTIPSSVNIIGDYAFSSCDNLQYNVYGNGWYLGNTENPYLYFAGCNRYSSPVLHPDVMIVSRYFTNYWDAKYNTYGNGKYLGTDSNPYEWLICTTSYSISSITVHPDTRFIADRAFDYTYITSVTLGSGIEMMGDRMFADCYNFKTIYITDLSAWLNVKFKSGGQDPLYYAQEIRLVSGASTELVIPENIKNIPEKMFKGCTEITSVTFEGNVSSIGARAFEGCTAIKAVYAPSLEMWNNIDFAHYTSDPLFYAKKLYIDGAPVESAEISHIDGEVGDYAFIGSTTLKTVTIKSGVSRIGEWAFRGCTALTDVYIPQSVTEIAANAFEKCTNITLTVAPGSYALSYAEENGISYVIDATVNESTDVAGDIDGDGIVTNSDITIIVRYISGMYDNYAYSNADVSGDGVINNRDIIILIRRLSLAETE